MGSHVPTTAAVRTLDRLQGDWYEGPCISAADHPPPVGYVLADDLDGLDAVRWPGFARYALDAGFHSILSVGLGSARGRAGALNLYATRPNVFDAPAREVARFFAARAATLVHGAAATDVDARTGTDTARPSPTGRDLIAQAVGILAGRTGVEVEAALDALVRVSDDTGLGMVEIAGRVRDAAYRETGLPFDLGNGVR
ncbi:ANTAR domain-containing protein [Actinomycetospora succinea]|uniref:ANTAR domain-containing protein n=1 Tax=Actinomycetospora succinea TaxID=663603 RepID=UPI001414DD52|nr:ANTAR domain-containing protein [Actinomycetospora succinea]